MQEKKHKRKYVVFALITAVFFAAGCSRSSYMEKVYEADSCETEGETAVEESADIGPNEEDSIAIGEKAADSTTETIEKSETIKETENTQEENTLVIYICGAVHHPGVYELPENARVIHAIEAAGGLTEEADTMLVNQARYVVDGEQIRIVTKEEAEVIYHSGTDGEYLEVIGEGTSVSKETGKVNINFADEKELMTLPGIGKTKAAAIIQYRKEHGSFTSITDIMKISGIKESVFSKIEDLITV